MLLVTVFYMAFVVAPALRAIADGLNGQRQRLQRQEQESVRHETLLRESRKAETRDRATAISQQEKMRELIQENLRLQESVRKQLTREGSPDGM
jgi:hypothetical protein